MCSEGTFWDMNAFECRFCILNKHSDFCKTSLDPQNLSFLLPEGLNSAI
jgi:hypothetical protein